MNYEITGKLIVKNDTQDISDKFKKRDFVIEVENERNSDWNDFIKIQLTQDRCDLIDSMKLNDMVKVSFNLRGRKWEKDGKTSYFTNLEGWRVEKANNDTDNVYVEGRSEPDIEVNQTADVDDLPF